MMLNFKKSKLVVDCFTASTKAHDLYPISKATDYLPEWWKETPKSYMFDGFFPHSTIKKCSGFIDYYKQGIILPLWSDLAIQTSENGMRWQFADKTTSAEPHNPKQWETYVPSSDYQHLKISSPWAIKTKDDVNWVYQKPFWNFDPIEKNFAVPTGVVNYKKQHATHVNLFVALGEKEPFIIPAETPIAHLIPMSDKKIELRHHLVSLEEYNRLELGPVTFVNSYINKVRLKEKNSKKTCPFGFGR